MRKKFIWFLKVGVALTVAFGIMSGFCAFYYNLPIHYTNPSGSTDYSWEKGSYSVKCTEGFAKVRTDENGFVNTYKPKGEKIDALVMGSSHTEAFNVGEKENYTYLLNTKFSDDVNELYFYNIGTSGHTFQRCLRNLESAVNEYNPQKYIIIETVNVTPSISELESVKNDTLAYLPSQDSGLIYYLQKSDLFRRLYAQLSNILENEKLPTLNISKTEKASSSTPKLDKSDENVPVEYEKTLDAVMKKSSEIAKNSGCRLIIAYIPHLEIDYCGNIIEKKPSEQRTVFESICEKYDIGFVDMYDGFVNYYVQNHTLLQGFSNTGVGVGHINKYGHRVIAEELYNYITEENDK